MLVTLIPPILIILSLIGIILMLVKKSSQVANLPEDHFEKEIGVAPARLGFFGRIAWKIKNIHWDDVKHFFLGILERITRRIRVIFLKLESRSADLSNNIRSQRQARTNRTAQNMEVRKENDILRKLKEYQPEKQEEAAVVAEESATEEIAAPEQKVETVAVNTNKKRFFARKNRLDEEEREVKPMVSEQLVTPRRRTEIKDRLEELLIERIAINPKDIEAYERLGEYYMEIKSYMDAKECFKQVIKLNPSDRNAKYRMRRLENILAKQ